MVNDAVRVGEQHRVDELRRRALDYAAQTHAGSAYTDILKVAKAYYEFLIGERT